MPPATLHDVGVITNLYFVVFFATKLNVFRLTFLGYSAVGLL